MNRIFVRKSIHKFSFTFENLEKAVMKRKLSAEFLCITYNKIRDIDVWSWDWGHMHFKFNPNEIRDILITLNKVV